MITGATGAGTLFFGVGAETGVDGVDCATAGADAVVASGVAAGVTAVVAALGLDVALIRPKHTMMATPNTRAALLRDCILTVAGLMSPMTNPRRDNNKRTIKNEFIHCSGF